MKETVMNKIVNILCAASVLLMALSGCQKKDGETVKTVDLRYRAQSSYDLPATGAQSFTILVASSEPWTVTSAHPDWCIISEEEGVASDPELVHTGKADATTIRVQYYDNTGLDDREDKITIKSDYWVGKVITVTQKGIAFLTIPDSDLDLSVEKAGGDYFIHIKSNQDWSSKVTDGEWLSIAEGATGNGDGTVTVATEVNAKELRYGEVTVYDRHQKASAIVKFTQDGVQLVPATEELRVGYDQASGELAITSNTKWKVTKESGDDWFDIVTGEGEKDGSIKFSFNKNEGSGLRKATVILENIIENEGDFHVEKTIVVKQAYHVVPVTVMFDEDELAKWKQESGQAKYVKGQGMVFTNVCTLQNGSMPFGDYTFYWKDINAVNNGVRVRTVFAYDDIQEIKFGLRISSEGAKVMYLDFNASSSGKSGVPEKYTVPKDLDFSVPHTFSCRFLPIVGSEYCHVCIYMDGNMILDFDTSEKILDEVKWGTKINMYLSVDSGGSGDSAVLEKYEYSEPLNWDD